MTSSIWPLSVGQGAQTHIIATMVLDSDFTPIVSFPCSLNRDGKGTLRAIAFTDAHDGREEDPFIAHELTRED
jgi:hypothetical protein